MPWGPRVPVGPFCPFGPGRRTYVAASVSSWEASSLIESSTSRSALAPFTDLDSLAVNESVDDSTSPSLDLNFFTDFSTDDIEALPAQTNVVHESRERLAFGASVSELKAENDTTESTIKTMPATNEIETRRSSLAGRPPSRGSLYLAGASIEQVALRQKISRNFLK